jgi:hypothetical protein
MLKGQWVPVVAGSVVVLSIVAVSYFSQLAPVKVFAEFNPNDVDETAEWAFRLACQELPTDNGESPWMTKQFGNRMYTHFQQCVGRSVTWELPIDSLFDHDGHMYARVDKKFRALFHVNVPTLIAIREGALGDGDRRLSKLQQYVPVPATEYAKLKVGTAMCVSGKIAWASLNGVGFLDCNVAIARQPSPK